MMSLECDEPIKSPTVATIAFTAVHGYAPDLK